MLPLKLSELFNENHEIRPIFKDTTTITRSKSSLIITMYWSVLNPV